MLGMQNKGSPEGLSTLFHALMIDDETFVTEYSLIECELNDKFLGNTPLLWGVASSSIKAVLSLLNKSPDGINTAANQFTMATPLILSISKGWGHKKSQEQRTGTFGTQSEVAIRLVELGAEVNARDRHGRTALHYAYLQRNPDAIKPRGQIQ